MGDFDVTVQGSDVFGGVNAVPRAVVIDLRPSVTQLEAADVARNVTRRDFQGAEHRYQDVRKVLTHTELLIKNGDGVGAVVGNAALVLDAVVDGVAEAQDGLCGVAATKMRRKIRYRTVPKDERRWIAKDRIAYIGNLLTFRHFHRAARPDAKPVVRGVDATEDDAVAKTVPLLRPTAAAVNLQIAFHNALTQRFIRFATQEEGVAVY